MFRGRFEHSIDEKGRLAIPAKFRAEMVDSDAQTFIVTNLGLCLAAYPLSEWLALEQKISKLPQFNPGVQSFLRYFVSGATECPLDKAGRILVPANLREFASIERDCVIAGQLRKFEIWSTTIWQKEFMTLGEKFGMVTAAIADFGIEI